MELTGFEVIGFMVLVIIIFVLANIETIDYFVIDTSFLMERIGVNKKNLLFELPCSNVYIHSMVLKELEGLKRNKNEDTRKRAIKALKHIHCYMKKRDNLIITKEFISKDILKKIPYLDSFTDKIVVGLAYKLKSSKSKVILLTVDNNQGIAARSLQIQTDDKYYFIDYQHKSIFSDSSNSSVSEIDISSDYSPGYPDCIFTDSIDHAIYCNNNGIE